MDLNGWVNDIQRPAGDIRRPAGDIQPPANDIRRPAGDLTAFELISPELTRIGTNIRYDRCHRPHLFCASAEHDTISDVCEDDVAQTSTSQREKPDSNATAEEQPPAYLST